MIYQARISLQTAALLEYIRQKLESESGGFVSKGEALNRAHNISQWTEGYDFDIVWNAIHSTPMPETPLNDLKLSENSNLLKVDINPIVKDSIQEMKAKLPHTLEARSVTIGVVIRELLKSAYILMSEDYKTFFIKRGNFLFEEHKLISEAPINTQTKTNANSLVREARLEIDQILKNLEQQLTTLNTDSE